MSKNKINRKAPYELVKDAVYKKYIESCTVAGTRLPSDRALSAEFQVNIATVAKGLSALANEGLVERKVGSGTYVCAPSKIQSPLVGIYLGAPTLSYSRPEMLFYAKLDQLLQQALHDRDGTFLHYADSRIPEYWGEPHQSLLSDAHSGKLSSLIVIRANPSNYAWLQKLPTKVIGYGVDYGHSVVDLDLEFLSAKSVEYLAMQGCKTIGLITKLPPTESKRAISRSSLHKAFHTAVTAHGMQSLPEWIQYETFDNTLSDREPMDAESFGYAAFQAIWNAPQRPEALVVYFDIVSLGVIRAARTLGVNLNSDIKIIFAANKGCDWALLEDKIRMSFSVKEVAGNLLELTQLTESQYRFIRPVLIDPHNAPSLLPGNSLTL